MNMNYTSRNTCVHIWDKYEITLEAEVDYPNPYTDVEVWAELKGPGFAKRVYGFWDGGRVFRIRIAQTAVGIWSWVTRSNTCDNGLNGNIGGFSAIEWTDAEKEANPCRRGFLKASANGRALEYADGSPFFLTGDTWLAGATFRFLWRDGDVEYPLGPEAGFKDFVRFRKQQGFNSVVMLACFPAWADDGMPYRLATLNGEIIRESVTDLNAADAKARQAEWFDQLMSPDTQTIRDSWVNPDTKSGKDMYNEGGRPFLFPGKAPGFEAIFPDMDRINPEYFKYLDKRMDYLNANGFIPFLESMRRDVTQCWRRYHDWPSSYVRYVQYIYSRYQANNCFMSPIHFDWSFASVSTDEFNICANLVSQKYGLPPFGTLLSANANPTTLINFEEDGAQSWIGMQLLGNKREHEHYWLITEMFRNDPARPVLNGEPYYAGYFNLGELYGLGAEGGTETDAQYCRSGMYGGFLSGAFAGHMYGAEGIWGADIEHGSKHKMWNSFTWSSAAQLQNLRKFVFAFGKRYQELLPEAELITPNKSGAAKGYTGWSYCAHTKDKDLVLLYFEKDHPGVFEVRRLRKNRTYAIRWFDTVTGEWSDGGCVESDSSGVIYMEMDVFSLDKGMSLILEPIAT